MQYKNASKIFKIMSIKNFEFYFKFYLGGKGQTIVLEQTETIKKPKVKQGAQITNKPLRQIQLSEQQPFCFEILHKNGRPISNLFIMPSDDCEYTFAVPR